MAGGGLVHFNGFRIRIVGNGNLIPTFFGFDDLLRQQLSSFALSQQNSIEPFRLANFISQRARLKIEVTQIDETFKVNNITIFAKPLWSQYVGQ